jgi:hypothetical protein
MKAGPQPLFPDTRREVAKYNDYARSILPHQDNRNPPLLRVVGVQLGTTVIRFLKPFKVAILNEATINPSAVPLIVSYPSTPPASLSSYT